MRIIMDVDGVVADFTGHLLRLVRSPLGPDDIVAWQVLDYLTAEQRTEAEQLLARPDFWTAQPILPGALNGVGRLRHEGHEIVWATSPWWSCVGWESARRDWLRSCFGADPRDVVITTRKELVRGDVFVDDKPEHVWEWSKAHPNGNAYLFDQPYNRAVSWPLRASWGGQHPLFGQAA